MFQAQQFLTQLHLCPYITAGRNLFSDTKTQNPVVLCLASPGPGAVPNPGPGPCPVPVKSQILRGITLSLTKPYII
jgi:hypothetical protein